MSDDSYARANIAGTSWKRNLYRKDKTRQPEFKLQDKLLENLHEY